ncbi:MAG TPA: DUF6263 family protein [Chitinophagaceae bacterium]|nr:DUF6263 family protein [Chitinophagaceae bacterium]
MKCFLIAALIGCTVQASGQAYQASLKFSPDQKWKVTTSVKTHLAQQVMNQAVDFDVDGEAVQLYTVTHAAGGSSTLRHRAEAIRFHFDGMGQKRSFDSKNDKDLSGPFGKPVRQLLDQSFDMVLDPMGRVLMVQPETLELEIDERLQLIMDLMSHLFDGIKPPQRGRPSFFTVLPDSAVNIGSKWNFSFQDSTGAYSTDYELSSLTDSTLVIDLKGKSRTSSASEMMGMEVITTLDNQTSGQILVDRGTGILREKNLVIHSSGSRIAMGGTMPVNATTNVHVWVTRSD